MFLHELKFVTCNNQHSAVSSPQLGIKRRMYVIIPNKVQSWTRSCGAGIFSTVLILLILGSIPSFDTTWPSKTNSCDMNWDSLVLVMSFFRFKMLITYLRSRRVVLLGFGIDNVTFEVN